MIFEYAIPHTLQTPQGNVSFNTGAGDELRLTAIDGAGDVRAVVDAVAQRDGGIVHPFFKAPRYVTLTGLVKVPSSFTTRRTTLEDLVGKANSMLRTDGRLYWTPSGYGDQRFLDRIRLSEPVRIRDSQLGGLYKEFEFQIVAADPCVYDSTQTTTVVTVATSPVTITNLGNAISYPVIRVSGTASFTLTNTTLGQSIVMSGLSLGGGYAEITTGFKETIYLNGNGANLTPFLDVVASDFWYLQPGANSITMSGGGSASILWNNAWA